VVRTLSTGWDLPRSAVDRPDPVTPVGRRTAHVLAGDRDSVVTARRERKLLPADEESLRCDFDVATGVPEFGPDRDRGEVDEPVQCVRVDGVLRGRLDLDGPTLLDSPHSPSGRLLIR
jgi:hypothetical protein